MVVMNRMPPVPGLPSLHKFDVAEKSPYYVRPENMTPLQKHCAYFDRDHDGIVMPWETYTGMRILGYSLFLSLLGTFVIHFFFSYWTLDGWLPDPLFPILIKNVDRLKHGSDTEMYEHDGTIKPLVGEPTVTLLSGFDNGQKGGLSGWDLLWMTQKKWDMMDVFGWWASKLEWFFLWVLVQRNGLVRWDDIRRQYDGTLFKDIEAERRKSGLIH